MEFVKTKSPVAGVKAVSARLKKELKGGQRVLWLMCGGSGIAAEVEILNALRTNKHIDNLAIMLMDERFGPVGHADSNWQQLLEAGADFSGLYALPLLTDSAKSLEQTVADYSQLTEVVLSAADVVIGQFGMGADGHIAGMLPNSPAARKSAPSVVGYTSKPFVRISMTHKALSQVDVAYVFAFGNEKKVALQNLQANKKSFAQMPSKLFWGLPEAVVYNDQIGKNA